MAGGVIHRRGQHCRRNTRCRGVRTEKRVWKGKANIAGVAAALLLVGSGLDAHAESAYEVKARQTAEERQLMLQDKVARARSKGNAESSAEVTTTSQGGGQGEGDEVRKAAAAEAAQRRVMEEAETKRQRAADELRTKQEEQRKSEEKRRQAEALRDYMAAERANNDKAANVDAPRSESALSNSGGAEVRKGAVPLILVQLLLIASPLALIFAPEELKETYMKKWRSLDSSLLKLGRK